MLLPLLALTLVPAQADPLLSALPSDAYVLVHCPNVARLEERARQNDWFRLLNSEPGEPFMAEFAREFQSGTHSDMNDALALAGALQGSVAFFDTGTVAGFTATPPANRSELAQAMRTWLPGEEAARGKMEIAGASVELVAWPERTDGWSGRKGHYAAFVDHPQLLGLYSGDDADAVTNALADGLSGLQEARTVPLVASYLAAGGGRSGGVELFVDFTPLTGSAEEALAEMAGEPFMEDPASLLGIDTNTWLHVTADLFPGVAVECRGLLNLPKDSLAAELANTFGSLPRTLPAELPGGVWVVWALSWDWVAFYEQARAAYVERAGEEAVASLDAGLGMARAMSGVDPIEDVLKQFTGVFAGYLTLPEDEMSDEWEGFGLLAGLRDGDTFLVSLEKLLDAGGLTSMFDLEVIHDTDAYLFPDMGISGGGFACLPTGLVVALSKTVLSSNLAALAGVEGASMDGSALAAALDENAAACYFQGVELQPMRRALLAEYGDGPLLPSLEEGEPGRDPFDAQLLIAVRRTGAGFELDVRTR